jgi:hypothetical protein
VDYSKMFAANPPSVLKLRDFRGIDQSVDENDLDPKFSRQSHNVDYYNGSIKYSRGASLVTNTPPYSTSTVGQIRDVFNLHYFYKRESDGTNRKWLVALCREYGAPATHGIWVKYDTIDGTYPYTWQKILDVTQTTSSGDPNAIKFQFRNYQDGSNSQLIFTTGADVYKWDGTYTGSTANQAVKLFYTSASEHAPQGTMIALYKDRVVVAGVKAQPDTGYWSDELAPSMWTINPDNPDDAGTVDIFTWDGDVLTALVPLYDELLIFKRRSLWRLSGDYPSAFALTKVADVGTANPYTVAVMNGSAYFMTHLGLMSFDGVNLTQPIPRGKVDILDDTYSEFADRSFTGIDTKVFAFDNKIIIVPSELTDTEYKHNYSSEDSKVVPEVVELDIQTGIISFRNDILTKYGTEDQAFGSFYTTFPINFAVDSDHNTLLCSGPISGTALNYGRFIFEYGAKDSGCVRVRWWDTPITLDVGSLRMFHAIPATDFGVAGKKKRVSKITVSGRCSTDGEQVKITPVCDGVAKAPITLTLSEEHRVLKPKIVSWFGRKIGLWIENVDGSFIEITDIELEYTVQGV